MKWGGQDREVARSDLCNDEPLDVNGSKVTPNVELNPAKLLTMVAKLARIIMAATSARALIVASALLFQIEVEGGCTDSQYRW